MATQRTKPFWLLSTAALTLAAWWMGRDTSSSSSSGRSEVTASEEVFSLLDEDDRADSRKQVREIADDLDEEWDLINELGLLA